MIKAIFINPFDKEVKLIDLSLKNNDLVLEECYKLIDCDLVEFVYSRDHRLLIVDEEGLLKEGNLPFKVEGVGQEYFVGKALIVNETTECSYSSITSKEFEELQNKISFPTVEEIRNRLERRSYVF